MNIRKKKLIESAVSKIVRTVLNEEYGSTLQAKGYTKIKRGNLYGIRNANGDVIIEPKYTDISDDISYNGIVIAKDANHNKVKIDIYSYDDFDDEYDED